MSVRAYSRKITYIKSRKDLLLYTFKSILTFKKFKFRTVEIEDKFIVNLWSDVGVEFLSLCEAYCFVSCANDSVSEIEISLTDIETILKDEKSISKEVEEILNSIKTDLLKSGEDYCNMKCY